MRPILGILLALVFAAPVLAAEEYPPKDTLEASIYRGDIVYHNYCVLCHGLTGEGNGRAAKMYNPKPANLVTSDKNDLYKELIIRRGGEAMGRSKFMPPWGNELTDEQVADVIAYLASINKREQQPAALTDEGAKSGAGTKQNN